MIRRREFVFNTTIAVLGVSTAAAERQPQGTLPYNPIVDTHLHCFAGMNDPRFPYHPRGPYKPDPAATPEDLLRCMAGAGVNFAVVVHPEPYQDDHRYLEHCLQVGKLKLKGTALVFADQPESVAQLAGQVNRSTGRRCAFMPARPIASRRRRRNEKTRLR